MIAFYHRSRSARSRDRRLHTMTLSIAIVGAGIGGLTAAALLLREGHEVQVLEQARGFAAVGAGIQLTANAVKALRPLGITEHLRAKSFIADAAWNRDAVTGEITNVLTMGEALERRYGAPDLMMQRHLLHDALVSLVPNQHIQLGRRLVAIEPGPVLVFEDGSRTRADLVIGADGIHSRVREHLLGAEAPRYTGRVAYRTIYPVARLGGLAIDPRAKWWGADRHIVHYYVNERHDQIYFIAVVPEPDYRNESWSTVGDTTELLAAFEDFHPKARAILAAAPEVRKWSLIERDPLPRWHDGNIVLLGDACHPMMPFMAQGAASAIEDAVILSRCLRALPVSAALERYEALRKPRTSRIQLTNRQNQWLKGKTDTDWVYEYDPWGVTLGISELQ